MDNSFGPGLLGHFDFTLLFIDAVFHIIPAGFILSTSVFFLAKIKNGTPAVQAGRLLWVKLALAVALAAVQITNAVLWFQSPLESTLAEAASVLTCVSVMCIGIILFANHVYFVQGLPCLGLFLTITLLLDIATTRAYFRRNGLHTIASLHVAIPVLKGLLIAAEEKSKRSLVISPALREDLGSEAFAGFLSKSMYMWFNPIMRYGVRNTVTTAFLPGISNRIDPVALYRRFTTIWENADKGSKYALAKSCFLTVPWPYVYVIFPRLVFIGFKFSQPFLLQDVVNAVSAKTQDSDLQMSLIFATGIIYIGMAVSPHLLLFFFTFLCIKLSDIYQFSRSWFLYLLNQMSTSTKAILTTAIYHKSLRITSDEAERQAAVTLVDTDVASIMQLISLSYESWASLVEVLLGITILALFVGAASIFALIPTSCKNLPLLLSVQGKRD